MKLYVVELWVQDEHVGGDWVAILPASYTKKGAREHEKRLRSKYPRRIKARISAYDRTVG